MNIYCYIKKECKKYCKETNDWREEPQDSLGAYISYWLLHQVCQYILRIKLAKYLLSDMKAKQATDRSSPQKEAGNDTSGIFFPLL